MALIDEIPDNGPRKQQIYFKDEPLAAKSTGTILIVPMAFVHALLSVLVRYQYGQDVTAKQVFADSWPSLPLFYVFFRYVHPFFIHKWAQALLAAFTAAITMYLIQITNEKGYYAVMYQAPPLGTLIICGIIELNIAWSMVVLTSIGLFLWYTGYGL